MARSSTSFRPSCSRRLTRVPADPKARQTLVLRLAGAAAKREPSELRGFLSFIAGAYSAEIALDAAAIAILSARDTAAELIAAVADPAIR